MGFSLMCNTARIYSGQRACICISFNDHPCIERFIKQSTDRHDKIKLFVGCMLEEQLLSSGYCIYYEEVSSSFNSFLDKRKIEFICQRSGLQKYFVTRFDL